MAWLCTHNRGGRLCDARRLGGRTAEWLHRRASEHVQAVGKVVYQIESVTLVEGKQFGKKTTSAKETVLLRGKGAMPGPGESAAAGAQSIKRLRTKLDIAERLLDCEILELTTEVAGEKVITRIFTCPAVPFGIVRIENGDQVTQELVAFGRGEE